MFSVSVYQLPIEHPNAYRDYDFVIKRGPIVLSDYNKVWEGEFYTDNLNRIFYLLNIEDKPAGYKGTSLSTSNIIEVDGVYHYVDDFGFVTLLAEDIK